MKQTSNIPEIHCSVSVQSRGGLAVRISRSNAYFLLLYETLNSIVNGYTGVQSPEPGCSGYETIRDKNNKHRSLRKEKCRDPGFCTQCFLFDIFHFMFGYYLCLGCVFILLLLVIRFFLPSYVRHASSEIFPAFSQFCLCVWPVKFTYLNLRVSVRFLFYFNRPLSCVC